MYTFLLVRGETIKKISDMFKDPRTREWYGILNEYDEFEIPTKHETTHQTITTPDCRSVEISLKEFKHKAGEVSLYL